MFAIKKKSATAMAVIAVGLSVGLGGCYTADGPMTDKAYAASDGIRAEFSDDVVVENLMVVVPADSTTGYLLGMAVNHDKAEHSVSVTGSQGVFEVTLAGNSSENMLGSNVMIADAVAGATVPVEVVVDGSPTTVEVPVLDGTLEEYAKFLEEQGAQ